MRGGSPRGAASSRSRERPPERTGAGDHLGRRARTAELVDDAKVRCEVAGNEAVDARGADRRTGDAGGGEGGGGGRAADPAGGGEPDAAQVRVGDSARGQDVVVFARDPDVEVDADTGVGDQRREGDGDATVRIEGARGHAAVGDGGLRTADSAVHISAAGGDVGRGRAGDKMQTLVRAERNDGVVLVLDVAVGPALPTNDAGHRSAVDDSGVDADALLTGGQIHFPQHEIARRAERQVVLDRACRTGVPRRDGIDAGEGGKRGERGRGARARREYRDAANFNIANGKIAIEIVAIENVVVERDFIAKDHIERGFCEATGSTEACGSAYGETKRVRAKFSIEVADRPA